jgi:uncharacterized protein YbcI
MSTKGQLEAEICESIIKFEKEFMGRGPLSAKTYVIDDLVLVRLQGVLTPAEHQLVRSDDPARGRDLIKQVRAELIEKGRPLLYAVISSLTGRKVKSLHTDISTTTGERIILFTLDLPLDLV